MVESQSRSESVYNRAGDASATFFEKDEQRSGRIFRDFGEKGAKRSLRGRTDPNPFRYCGEYFDFETGEIYLRARSYDPSNGRFTSEDSITQTLGKSADENESIISQSLNLYIYGENNPITFSDPSGMISIANNKPEYIAKIRFLYPISTPPEFKGEPGYGEENYKGDYYHYGEDGYADYEYHGTDHNKPHAHPQDQDGGHYHDITYDENGNPVYGDPYVIDEDGNKIYDKDYDAREETVDLEEILEVINEVSKYLLIILVIIALLVLVLDNVTGVGVVDDVLIPGLIAFLLGLMGFA